MLGTITKGAYDNTPLPDNVYLAKLVKVTEKAPPASHPEWYPSLSWSFELLQDPFKKRRAWGKTPTSWIAGKKLDNWLVTLGINVGKGTSIKIEDIKDIPVKILIRGKKYNDKQTGEEKVFSEVTDLLPLDSIDQIKIRELIAGVPMTNVVASATNAVPPQSTMPLPTSVIPAGTPFTQPVPVTPTVPTFTPASQVTGTPSRTIPF